MALMDISLPTLAATLQLAQKLAPLLKRGDVVAMMGPLGTGKTECARAILRALGVSGDVPSPTFTLLQTYDTKNFPVSHFDLYRIKDPTELDELGWDDAIADSLVLVEWPERAGNRLLANHLTLSFTINDKNDRHCTIEAPDAWAQRMTGMTL